MELFFKIKTFKSVKEVFNGKNFNSRQKVMESFFIIENFKTTMVSFFSFKYFKSRKTVMGFFFEF